MCILGRKVQLLSWDMLKIGRPHVAITCSFCLFLYDGFMFLQLLTQSPVKMMPKIIYVHRICGGQPPLRNGRLKFYIWPIPEHGLFATVPRIWTLPNFLCFFILLFFSFWNLSKFLIWVILTTSQVLRKFDSLASNMSWVWLLIGPFSFKTPKVFIPFSFQISSERSRVARKRELLGNV